MSVFEKARVIAVADLRVNYGDMGIYASPGKHREYWARDGFVASFGACAVGDFEQVRKTLDLFTAYQREDGHIPARVERGRHFLRLLGIKQQSKAPRALHRQSQPWASDVVDSNSWYIISAINYVETSKDNKWLANNKESLKLAADWLVGRIKNNGLVYEGFTANWFDCDARRGFLVYNNVLAWRALDGLGKILTGGNKTIYLNYARKLKVAILKNFWDEDLGYFIARIDEKGKRYSYFSSDGNLWAIVFGLASKKQSEKIVNFIDANGLSETPIVNIYPRLDWWNALVNKTVFPMYKASNIFTWLGGVSVLARLEAGAKRGALRDLERIAKKIVEYGCCHEVLTHAGKPVNLWFYKSERQIAWTAGLYLYAYDGAKKRGIV